MILKTPKNAKFLLPFSWTPPFPQKAKIPNLRVEWRKLTRSLLWNCTEVYCQNRKKTRNFNQEFIKFWYILCNNLLITSNNHFYQCRQSLTGESWTGSLLFYHFITFFHKFKCYLLVQYDVLPE